MTSSLHGSSASEQYAEFMKELDKRHLTYLAQRLPKADRVKEIVTDKNGVFYITLKNNIDGAMIRDGKQIPGAKLHLGSQIKGSFTDKGIEIEDGISGSGIGISGKVTRISSNESGDIKLEAEGPFGLIVRQSFHPKKQKSLLGGTIKFDPESINVAYPPSEVSSNQKEETPNVQQQYVLEDEKQSSSACQSFTDGISRIWNAAFPDSPVLQHEADSPRTSESEPSRRTLRSIILQNPNLNASREGPRLPFHTESGLDLFRFSFDSLLQNF